MFSFRGYYSVAPEPIIGFIDGWIILKYPFGFGYNVEHGWNQEEYRI